MPIKVFVLACVLLTIVLPAHPTSAHPSVGKPRDALGGNCGKPKADRVPPAQSLVTNFDDADLNNVDGYPPPADQMTELKRVISRVTGPQRADLLFQLAELWWQKSKIRSHHAQRDFARAHEAWEQRMMCAAMRDLPLVLAEYADELRESGQCDVAIEVYRALVDDEPDSPANPEHEYAILLCHRALDQRAEAEAQARRILDLYRPSGEWAQRNASNAQVRAGAQEFVEGALRWLVSEADARARKTRMAADYRSAAAVRREYLELLGGKPVAVAIRFRRAEILWALREYEAAAEEYERVVDADPTGEHARAAVLDAVLCYQMLADAEHDGRLFKKPADGERIDEAAPKPRLAVAPAGRCGRADESPRAAQLCRALSRQDRERRRAP